MARASRLPHAGLDQCSSPAPRPWIPPGHVLSVTPSPWCPARVSLLKGAPGGHLLSLYLLLCLLSTMTPGEQGSGSRVRGQSHVWPWAWPPQELQPQPLDEPNTNAWASLPRLWRRLRALKYPWCKDMSGLETGLPPQLCGLDSSLGLSKRHFVCKMWIPNSQGCSED